MKYRQNGMTPVINWPGEQVQLKDLGFHWLKSGAVLKRLSTAREEEPVTPAAEEEEEVINSSLYRLGNIKSPLLNRTLFSFKLP